MKTADAHNKDFIGFYHFNKYETRTIERAIEMIEKPVRIQRSRQHKMVSPNGLPIVCVDRTTKLGNPFIVGKHGALNQCLWRFVNLCNGIIFRGMDKKCMDRQQRFIDEWNANKENYRNKNFACFCPIGKPCHADILLKIANQR